MFEKIIKIMGSYRVMAVFIFIYITSIAIATFVESYQDTLSARVLIYNSWWFLLLQFFMAVNFIIVSIKRKLFAQHKYGVLLLHYGLVVVLAGALTTHFYGKEGVMMIREDAKSDFMLSSDTYITLTLKKGDKEITKTQRARYGKLTEDKFDIKFQGITENEINVKFLSYMGNTSSGVVNVEVINGDDIHKISIEGGKYFELAPVIYRIGDADLYLSYGSIREQLPFSVHLNDFDLERYPGSASPSSYSSDVVIEYKGEKKEHDIYMNNIAYVGDYRIYQTSYDKDEKGTVLTVNHDLIGTIITYIGYLMLAFGLILSLLHRSSRFATLLRRLKEISASAILVFILLPLQTFAYPTNSVEIARNAVDKETADKFSELLVQNPNGRVEPVNSYALKLLRKINRSSTYKDLTPTQVIIGLISDPYTWSSEPLIYISNEQLAKEVDAIDGEYVSYNSLFNKDGEYKLQSKVEKIYNKRANEQNKYEKEILKLDEKANILNALFNGQMFRLFPVEDDENNRWISMGEDLSVLKDSRDSSFVAKIIPGFLADINDGSISSARELISLIEKYQNVKANKENIISKDKIKGEIFYNNVNIFKQSAIAYLAMGAIMLIVLLSLLLKGNKNKFADIAIMILSIGLLIAFLWQTFGIGLRWYISGRAPWTNSYESMIYVGWSAILLGLAFARRSKVTLAISALMAGAIMMISQLNILDPEITPLVPVLKSYWLMFHVATITASYGFFGVSALIGIAVMIIFAFAEKGKYRIKIEELSIINELAMTIGLVLLTIGIFIGAVWANESWGRYWGWDPKESWALITMVAYTFVIHARFIPSLRGRYIFNVMSIYTFYTVLMTFFGVNYYLSGMHSYGSVDSLPPLAIIIPTTIVVLLTLLAYRRSDN